MLAAGNTTGFVRNIRLFVTARVLNFILSDIVSLIWTSTVQSGYTDVDSGLSHVLAGLMLRVMGSEYANNNQCYLVLHFKTYPRKKKAPFTKNSSLMVSYQAPTQLATHIFLMSYLPTIDALLQSHIYNE